MDARKTLLLLAFAVALPAVGGMVAVPDAPTPAYSDLECVTNTPIRAGIDPEPGWIAAHPNTADQGHVGIVDYDGWEVGAGEGTAELFGLRSL